jgi:CRP/FNR family transcriptional regulator, cyclic AMP receptor protein
VPAAPEAALDLLEEFRALGVEARLAPGHWLWQENDAAGQAVLLVEGTLEVVQESPDGQVVVLRSLEPGALLGEMSCFDGLPHSATVRARVACRICRLDSAAFRKLARRHPSFLEELLLRQSERVRTLSRQVAALAFESVLRRLGRFLLQATTASERSVRLTHQEVSERVAATRESVSKALGTLSRKKLVRLSRGVIEVLDRPALELFGPDNED